MGSLQTAKNSTRRQNRECFQKFVSEYSLDYFVQKIQVFIHMKSLSPVRAEEVPLDHS